MIDQMPAFLAHEMRAPLTSLYLALCMLRGRLEFEMGADNLRILQVAIQNSERLEDLINDILDYAKLKAGKMPLYCAPLQAADLVREAAESLEAWAAAKGLRLTVTEGIDGLPYVLADRRRALQVLVNLLSNAIKFTASGGSIEIGASLGDGQDTTLLVLSVRDTGRGIAAVDHDRIFRSFEQSSCDDSPNEGTGLGLALAKEIVELHGGRIWVESEPGHGAIFRFTLPLAAAHGLAAHEPGPTGPIRNGSRNPGQPRSACRVRPVSS